MKHRKLRAKNKRNRAKKLELQRAKAAGEWTPQPVPVLDRVSKVDAQSVLFTHCQNREIKLNERQRKKPWIMALLTHRYDTGVRDPGELNAGGLRHVLTPDHKDTHQYILDTTSPNAEHRFCKSAYKKAREKIRTGRMATFAEEAWKAMSERNIPPPVPNIKDKVCGNPPVFLSLFAWAMAEAEPEGSIKVLPPTVPKKKKVRQMGKAKQTQIAQETKQSSRKSLEA